MDLRAAPGAVEGRLPRRSGIRAHHAARARQPDGGTDQLLRGGRPGAARGAGARRSRGRGNGPLLRRPPARRAGGVRPDHLPDGGGGDGSPGRTGRGRRSRATSTCAARSGSTARRASASSRSGSRFELDAPGASERAARAAAREDGALLRRLADAALAAGGRRPSRDVRPTCKAPPVEGFDNGQQEAMIDGYSGVRPVPQPHRATPGSPPSREARDAGQLRISEAAPCYFLPLQRDLGRRADHAREARHDVEDALARAPLDVRLEARAGGGCARSGSRRGPRARSRSCGRGGSPRQRSPRARRRAPRRCGPRSTRRRARARRARPRTAPRRPPRSSRAAAATASRFSSEPT